MEMINGRVQMHWRFLCFMLAFVLIFMLGGAEAKWGWPTLMVLIATCVIAFTAQATAFRALNRSPLTFRLAVALLMASIVLQLIPLPLDVWSIMPGQSPRSDVVRTFLTTETWLPISQVPMWTAYTGIMLLGSLAALAAMVDMTTRQFQWISYMIIVLIAISIGVGVLQFASNGVMLKFHVVANDGALLGFFANKNHAASVIAMSIPIARALLVSTRRVKQENIVSALYTIIALLAVIATNSRAGLALAVISAAVTHLDQLLRAPWRTRLGAAGLVLLLFMAVYYSQTFQIVADRTGQIGADGRWLILDRSMPLLHSFWLTGSGWGSYVTIYQTRESLDWLTPTYVNNAHNDFLQIAIEGGILACVALVAAVFALIKLVLTVWRDSSGSPRRLALAGTIAVAIIILHSVVDYPLRRPAALFIFLYALAAILRGYHQAATGVNEHSANGGLGGTLGLNDSVALQSVTVRA